MTDKLTPEHRSRNMAAIRSKGMKPERIVRSLVHGMGYRYRLHRKGLPGKPDLVFGPRRKLIFVHGCFWHQHDDPVCKIARKPRSNLDYWEKKLSRNVARDQRNLAALEAVGWSVLTVWECETKHLDTLKARLHQFLSP
ncbi:MAG: DNA mismatch endonuclease, patch repair protein [Oceanicaulis sp. HLUCCA04]|nr:MAG: DNA mismatch endonuclease, patch repair protein [Oceanicaulis sp. HLUCCA04]